MKSTQEKMKKENFSLTGFSGKLEIHLPNNETETISHHTQK